MAPALGAVRARALPLIATFLLASAPSGAAERAGAGGRDACAPAGIRAGTDVVGPVLCAAFPRGIDNQTLAQCCAACDADATCTSFVLVPPVGTCWPLVSYDHLVAAPDRTFGGQGPPPPPPDTPPPASWAPRVAAGDMLYSSEDFSVPRSQLPMIGNGMLATQVMSDSIFVAGLFNGWMYSVSHRARLPATSAVAAPGNQSGAALDVREATYFRRSWIDPSPPGACTAASTQSCSNAPARITVEQRWYAHRALPSVMVMEVQVLPSGNGDGVSDGPAGPSPAADAPPFAMLRLVNEPGANSSDVELVPLATPPGSGYSASNGSTLVAEASYAPKQAVCVLTTDLPASGALTVSAAAPFATAFFFTVIRTSVETAPAQLLAAAQVDLAQAAALAAQGKLRSSHVAEWAATVWGPAGFETDRFDVARAANSSLYAIVSSFRVDRPFGLSPGGLTAGYNGHAFWDCE